MTIQTCLYEPLHEHTYPGDWQFGGPSGSDPRTDPRFRPEVYTYLDDGLREVWVTSAPACDDEALDRFSDHRPLKPVYLQVKRRDGSVDLLSWRYDAASDTLYPMES